MLDVIFYNVGDGDCTLLKETGPDGEHAILFDTGRPHVEFVDGSLRRPAISRLMCERLPMIDLIVLSHPHFDHIGGALAIMRHFPVKALTALYFPNDDARWIDAPEDEEKTVVGFCDALNMLRDIKTEAENRGSICTPAKEGTFSIGSMSLTFYLPDIELRTRQNTVFDELYAGAMPPHDTLYAASKDRNCSSIMMRVEYAGRSILLTGDSYGAYWENNGMPHCDILKVPHHGDGKSMTEKLISSLSPEYAVISCQNDTSPKKDRPNADIAELLQMYCGEVLCTENKPLPTYPATMHDAIRFTIDESGKITRLS